jgi:DnaJ-class molecular chaperone
VICYDVVFVIVIGRKEINHYIDQEACVYKVLCDLCEGRGIPLKCDCVRSHNAGNNQETKSSIIFRIKEGMMEDQN